MKTDNEDLNLSIIESDYSQEEVRQRQVTAWIKWLATGLTLISCLLYGVLFSLISKYQLLVVDTVKDLPLSLRIMLNIYQPFLLVFILVSVSLWVLWQLSMKKPGSRYKLILALVVINSLVAAALLGISFVKIG